jgi:DNA mismatch endonuclease, patch repair protein
MPRGLPKPSSVEAQRRMTATRRRDTAAEKSLAEALVQLGADFVTEFAPIPGIRRRADIAFPKQRVAVFVDGCFWHGCPVHGSWPRANSGFWRDKILANVQRDADTDQRLREAGWIVMRFWEHHRPADAALTVLHKLPHDQGKPSTIKCSETRSVRGCN